MASDLWPVMAVMVRTSAHNFQITFVDNIQVDTASGSAPARPPDLPKEDGDDEDHENSRILKEATWLKGFHQERAPQGEGDSIHDSKHQKEKRTEKKETIDNTVELIHTHVILLTFYLQVMALHGEIPNSSELILNAAEYFDGYIHVLFDSVDKNARVLQSPLDIGDTEMTRHRKLIIVDIYLDLDSYLVLFAVNL